jgi:hypothetical protein
VLRFLSTANDMLSKFAENAKVSSDKRPTCRNVDLLCCRHVEIFDPSFCRNAKMSTWNSTSNRGAGFSYSCQFHDVVLLSGGRNFCQPHRLRLAEGRGRCVRHALRPDYVTHLRAIVASSGDAASCTGSRQLYRAVTYIGQLCRAVM